MGSTRGLPTKFRPNTFFNRKSGPRCRILDISLKCQRSACASRRHTQVLAARFQHIDHVCITTQESFRSHKNKFDKIRCKMDSNENPRSRNNPTLTVSVFSSSFTFKLPPPGGSPVWQVP